MKKDPLIVFPFYCNQYMGMLAKYTYEEQGAFMRVLATFIAEDGIFSCDSKQARYRLFSAFTNSEQNSIDKVFKDSVQLAKQIMEKQKAIRQKKRENGTKGGRPVKNQMDNQMDNQMGNQMGKLNITYTDTDTDTDKNTDKDTIILHHDESINTLNITNRNLSICRACGCPLGESSFCPSCEMEAI